MKGLLLCDNGQLSETVQLCTKYHCGIEVQAFYEPNFLNENPDSVDLHIHELKDIKIKSLHGPFADLCMGSYDELIREVTRKRFDYAYNVAMKLNITDIILHHGYVPKTSNYRNWIKRTVAFWNDFLFEKSDNIKFHLENMLELDPFLLSDVISGINNENVDVCLDIGHAHCNSNTSVVDWIKYLKKQIGYVHLHDNHGEYDEHLGFGEGNIPIMEVFTALDEFSPDAFWAVETNQSNMINSLEFILEERGDV